MNDSQLITWVAQHLAVLRIGFQHAYMEFLDDNGESHNVTFKTDETNPSDEELFRGCISEARKMLTLLSEKV